MRMLKITKAAALLLAALTVLTLGACSLPRPGFADYDVSGYVKALLDSSYHDDHVALTEIAGITEESAREYNAATVENAVVTFCNTYGVYPDSAQREEFNAVMKQAFALTRYTVKEERKVDGGYYLEVEIAPISNFAGRQADIAALKAEAQAEADAVNHPAPTPTPQPEEEEEPDDQEEPEPTPTPVPPAPVQKVNADELFVEKVLDFCRRELANISYDADSRTVALNIVQTEQGQLQLDLNEIEIIDNTVIRIG